MKCFAILLAEFFRHAYFRAMLILRCHSFGKCLFSSHAYFQERAYYRENTVGETNLLFLIAAKRWR